MPIKFEGYSISQRRYGITPKGGGDPKWRACVRIDKPTYKELKAFILDSGHTPFGREFEGGFRPHPVCEIRPDPPAIAHHLASRERARARMGYDPVPHTALQLRRTPIKVYQDSKTRVLTSWLRDGGVPNSHLLNCETPRFLRNLKSNRDPN